MARRMGNWEEENQKRGGTRGVMGPCFDCDAFSPINASRAEARQRTYGRGHDLLHRLNVCFCFYALRLGMEDSLIP